MLNTIATNLQGIKLVDELSFVASLLSACLSAFEDARLSEVQMELVKELAAQLTNDGFFDSPLAA